MLYSCVTDFEKGIFIHVEMFS